MCPQKRSRCPPTGCAGHSLAGAAAAVHRACVLFAEMTPIKWMLLILHRTRLQSVCTRRAGQVCEGDGQTARAVRRGQTPLRPKWLRVAKLGLRWPPLQAPKAAWAQREEEERLSPIPAPRSIQPSPSSPPCTPSATKCGGCTPFLENAYFLAT